MKRIDDRTVELSKAEIRASDDFDALLNNGLSIIAAGRALRRAHPHLSPGFLLWLMS